MAFDREDSAETARMLELAIAQIEMSVRDADGSVESLVQSVISMADSIRNIEQELRRSPEEDEGEEITEAIRVHCALATQKMEEAITAFQFYDKLSQRLSHIRDCLGALAALILTAHRQHHELWCDLQKKTRSIYSMEQEQTILKAVISGVSADHAQETMNQEYPSMTGIDLF